MKERTLLILQALIQDFVETANPVASQRLLETHDFNVSSATVRNEFALLEEVGLITSPYVSSGKVPTAKGYRTYVDQMESDEAQEQIITSLFTKRLSEYKVSKSKESLFDALRVISQLSGNVAFASIDEDQTMYLGLSNVLRSPEFVAEPEKAAQIVEVLEGRERFRQFIHEINLKEKEVKIFIGEENIFDEITSCAMLITNIDSHNLSGSIGILGPMRMKYSYNKALLKSAADMVL